MKEQDFIKNSIDELVKRFPTTKVRYENHEMSNTHFIEVVPNEVYRLSKEYQQWEENVVFLFIEQFPNQNISFISDDAVVGIETVDYEVKGVFHDFLTSYDNSLFKNIEVKKIFTVNTNLSKKPIMVGEKHLTLNQITNLSFSFSNLKDLQGSNLSSYNNLIQSAIEKAGNIQYAMAA